MIGDIGVGILLAIFGNYVFGLPLDATLFILAICFALLPDIDMFGYPFQFLRKVFGAHREVTHYPILYVPVVIIVWLVFGNEWGMLLFLGVLIHFIHDTFWIGHGIKWLWPFSHKAIKFFEQDSKYEHLKEHWVRKFYFHVTVVSVWEYGLFLLSIIFLVAYL